MPVPVPVPLGSVTAAGVAEGGGLVTFRWPRRRLFASGFLEVWLVYVLVVGVQPLSFGCN